MAEGFQGYVPQEEHSRVGLGGSSRKSGTDTGFASRPTEQGKAGARVTPAATRSLHMKWLNISLRTRLYLFAAVILLVGTTGSALLYLTAEKTSDSPVLNDFLHSKKHRHDLELMGGKANVLVDRFCRWVEGLWQGESLACIVAGLTLLVSLGFCFVAYHVPPSRSALSRGRDHPTSDSRV